MIKQWSLKEHELPLNCMKCIHFPPLFQGLPTVLLSAASMWTNSIKFLHISSFVDRFLAVSCLVDHGHRQVVHGLQALVAAGAVVRHANGSGLALGVKFGHRLPLGSDHLAPSRPVVARPCDH